MTVAVVDERRRPGSRIRPRLLPRTLRAARMHRGRRLLPPTERIRQHGNPTAVLRQLVQRDLARPRHGHGRLARNATSTSSKRAGPKALRRRSNRRSKMGATVITNSWNLGFEAGNPANEGVCLRIEICVSKARRGSGRSSAWTIAGVPILFSGGDYGYGGPLPGCLTGRDLGRRDERCCHEPGGGARLERGSLVEHGIRTGPQGPRHRWRLLGLRGEAHLGDGHRHAASGSTTTSPPTPTRARRSPSTTPTPVAGTCPAGRAPRRLSSPESRGSHRRPVARSAARGVLAGR